MKFLYCILLLATLLSCKTQYINQSDLISGYETYDLKDYDERIKNGKIDTYEGKNYIEYRGTDIYIYPKHKYYRIVKEFYNNGNIKEKGLQFGSVNIGIWEYYNKQGELIKTVDEDKKFSPNFNYNNIIDFIHKRGKINKYHKKKRYKIYANFKEIDGIWKWGVRIRYDKTQKLLKSNKEFRYAFDKEGKVLEINEKIFIINKDHI